MDLVFSLVQLDALIKPSPTSAKLWGNSSKNIQVEMVSFDKIESNFEMQFQEEFKSEQYERIIFYNITAKPVTESFTLTHALQKQIKLLNIFHQSKSTSSASDKKDSFVSNI